MKAEKKKNCENPAWILLLIEFITFWYVQGKWFKCVHRLVSSGLRLGPGLPLG